MSNSRYADTDRTKNVFLIRFSKGSGYGYRTVPGGRWAIDTGGGHVVVSVSLIRNGYEYGRRSRGRFRIPPPAIVAICL